MALPQNVLERLSEQPTTTPGWSLGLISFAGGLFGIAIVIYVGLAFGYEPYVQGQINALNTQLATASQSISSKDQAQLQSFYSKTQNLNQVLQNHVRFSHFFSWLEKNTEANIYYTSLAFASGNQVRLTGSSPTETDVNQQMAIFESSPNVTLTNLTGVTFSSDTGRWQFTVTLFMNDLSNLTP